MFTRDFFPDPSHSWQAQSVSGHHPPPSPPPLISLNKYGLGGFYPRNTYTKAKPITFHQPHELHLPDSNSQDFAELADKILAVPTGYEPKGLWEWSSCNQLSTKAQRLALEEEVSMWAAEQTPRDRQICGNNLMPEGKANTGLFKFKSQCSLFY